MHHETQRLVARLLAAEPAILASAERLGTLLRNGTEGQALADAYDEAERIIDHVCDTED